MSVQLIPMKSKERKRFSPQQKTILRGDRGSPNMAAQTRKFVKDIEL
jgi:hypothetical protein